MRWAAHDVRLHRTGTAQFHHPVAGDLHLAYEAREPAAIPGRPSSPQRRGWFTPDSDAVKMLASWAATQTRPTPWLDRAGDSRPPLTGDARQRTDRYPTVSGP